MPRAPADYLPGNRYARMFWMTRVVRGQLVRAQAESADTVGREGHSSGMIGEERQNVDRGDDERLFGGFQYR